MSAEVGSKSPLWILEPPSLTSVSVAVGLGPRDKEGLDLEVVRALVLDLPLELFAFTSNLAESTAQVSPPVVGQTRPPFLL